MSLEARARASADSSHARQLISTEFSKKIASTIKYFFFTKVECGEIQGVSVCVIGGLRVSLKNLYESGIFELEGAQKLRLPKFGGPKVDCYENNHKDQERLHD